MDRLILIAGTRPEVIKLAPIDWECSERGVNSMLILSGQQAMARDAADYMGLTWTEELSSPASVASCLTELRTMYCDDRLIVVAQGDTSTVYHTAVACYHEQLPFAHVEAGLRTNDLAAPWPEEGYRRVADALATWMFCPTDIDRFAIPSADRGRAHVVGNTVIDAARLIVDRDNIKPREGNYVLLTLHRRESWGATAERILEGVAAWSALNPEIGVICPIHPNPNAARAIFSADIAALQIIDPMPYPETLAAIMGARFIFTDSGGIQEEAAYFGKRAVILREKTERIAGQVAGIADVVGFDPESIRQAGECALYAVPPRADTRHLYGDGNAAGRILDMLEV